MRGVGKQAVAGFVRGGRQSSGPGNRGALPVCHSERERGLPMALGGAYTAKSQETLDCSRSGRGLGTMLGMAVW